LAQFAVLREGNYYWYRNFVPEEMKFLPASTRRLLCFALGIKLGLDAIRILRLQFGSHANYFPVLWSSKSIAWKADWRRMYDNCPKMGPSNDGPCRS
jgi:hypothetical protein